MSNETNDSTLRSSNEFLGAEALSQVWSCAKGKFFIKTGDGIDSVLYNFSNDLKDVTTPLGLLRKGNPDDSSAGNRWYFDVTNYVYSIDNDTNGGLVLKTKQSNGKEGTGVKFTKAQLRQALDTDDNSGSTKLVTLDSNGKLRVSEMPDFILGQIVYGGTLSWANGVCTATLSVNGKAKLGVSGSTVTIVNSATGTSGTKGWKDCDGLFFISNFDAVDGTWPKTIGSQSDNKGIMKGDWLVPVVGSWDKVDNTDAVTGISMGDYDGATHTTKLGTVVIDADTLHVLSTTKTAKQTIKSDLYTEGALEAKNGVSAKGIHDLEQAGSGGGGTGGISVETSWDDVDPSSETQVVTANLSKQTKVAVDGISGEVDALGTRVGSLEGKFDGAKANQSKVADKVANKLTVGTKTYDGSGAVSITKTDLGLGNVDNTSDANKPVSTATQTELNKKVDKVTGSSLLADTAKASYDNHIASTSNPHGVTKSQVGLGNVGNFKAVSTVASQGLTDTEKSNARANIGAGTSSLAIGTTATTAAAGNHNHDGVYVKSQGTYANTPGSGTVGSSTATWKSPVVYSALNAGHALSGSTASIPAAVGTGNGSDGYMTAAMAVKLAGIATGATANTGTVTKVSISMNQTTVGTVTTSGDIDLGMVARPSDIPDVDLNLHYDEQGQGAGFTLTVDDNQVYLYPMTAARVNEICDLN